MPEVNPTDEFDSLSSGPLPGVDASGDGSPNNAPPQSSLRDDLDKAYGQLEEQRRGYLRLLADFDNYKKRAERLSGERADDERRKLLTRLLSVVDNLERAASFRESNVPPEQLVDGVLATLKQFRDFLESEGVRPIDVAGKPFDPNVAEAIAVQADAGAPDNVVTEVARKGYTLGGAVLRPAQVVVSKAV
mgnify:CR=1 FL=1